MPTQSKVPTFGDIMTPHGRGQNTPTRPDEFPKGIPMDNIPVRPTTRVVSSEIFTGFRNEEDLTKLAKNTLVDLCKMIQKTFTDVFVRYNVGDDGTITLTGPGSGAFFEQLAAIKNKSQSFTCNNLNFASAEAICAMLVRELPLYFRAVFVNRYTTDVIFYGRCDGTLDGTRDTKNTFDAWRSNMEFKIPFHLASDAIRTALGKVPQRQLIKLPPCVGNGFTTIFTAWSEDLDAEKTFYDALRKYANGVRTESYDIPAALSSVVATCKKVVSDDNPQVAYHVKSNGEGCVLYVTGLNANRARFIAQFSAERRN